MPGRAKKLDRAVARLPSIPKELAAQFLTGPMTGEAVNAAGIAFKQALIEASLNAELSHHLGYPPGAWVTCPVRGSLKHRATTATASPPRRC